MTCAPRSNSTYWLRERRTPPASASRPRDRATRCARSSTAPGRGSCWTCATSRSRKRSSSPSPTLRSAASWLGRCTSRRPKTRRLSPASAHECQDHRVPVPDAIVPVCQSARHRPCWQGGQDWYPSSQGRGDGGRMGLEPRAVRGGSGGARGLPDGVKQQRFRGRLHARGRSASAGWRCGLQPGAGGQSMRKVKLSTARNLMLLMVDSTDHVTGKTGLTLTITASKNGAAFGSITPTVTERGSGWYSLALTSAHLDTLGDLALHITGAAADPADVLAEVVAYDPQAATNLGLSNLDVASSALETAIATRAAPGDAMALTGAAVDAILDRSE